MLKGHSPRKLALLPLLLALLVGVTSCATAVAAGPRAWIDFPRDGASGPPNAPVPVICHASAPQGVAEVLLSVNGAPYRRVPADPVGATLCKLEFEWLPSEPGLYTLQATAYDTTGAASSPDMVTIRIGGAVPVEASDTPTPVPTTPTPTATAVPLTPTPTPTEPTVAPTVPTPTPTVPTPTPSPIPEVQVKFVTDRKSLAAGECALLQWAVRNATAVYLNGEGVVGEGTRSVCPDTTTTYTLHVEAPSGNVDESITITVSDTTPPPAPAPQVPAEGLVLDCRSTQTLAWLPVTDPSGIAGYDVTLERQLTASTWDTAQEWSQEATKEVSADVDCGPYYRWRVRAKDGAGNYSPWSAWAHFSVELP